MSLELFAFDFYGADLRCTVKMDYMKNIQDTALIGNALGMQTMGVPT